MKTMNDVDSWVAEHLQQCKEIGFPEDVIDIDSYAKGLCEGFASALMLCGNLKIEEDNSDIEIIYASC